MRSQGIERLITANQALILEKFGETSKYTPGFFDQYIVDRFVAGIVRLLQEVIADPRHPLAYAIRRFDTQAHRKAEDIAGDARSAARRSSVRSSSTCVPSRTTRRCGTTSRAGSSPTSRPIDRGCAKLRRRC